MFYCHLNLMKDITRKYDFCWAVNMWIFAVNIVIRIINQKSHNIRDLPRNMIRQFLFVIRKDSVPLFISLEWIINNKCYFYYTWNDPPKFLGTAVEFLSRSSPNGMLDLVFSILNFMSCFLEGKLSWYFLETFDSSV